MMQEKYLLFDLDGTLTDPGEGITNSVAYALGKFGISVADKRELYPYIGPPLTESFRRCHGLSAEQAKQAVGFYREYFSDKGMFENVPYDGVRLLLSELRNKGYTLLIATSKPEEFSIQILRHFSMEEYFDFVAGNTLDESRPTKAEVIGYLKEHYPLMNVDNALMIGDRKYDIDGAISNGLPSIGVLYGYGSRDELERAGATALAADLEDLRYRIEKLLPIEGR